MGDPHGDHATGGAGVWAVVPSGAPGSSLAEAVHAARRHRVPPGSAPTNPPRAEASASKVVRTALCAAKQLSCLSETKCPRSCPITSSPVPGISASSHSLESGRCGKCLVDPHLGNPLRGSNRFGRLSQGRRDPVLLRPAGCEGRAANPGLYWGTALPFFEVRASHDSCYPAAIHADLRSPTSDFRPPISDFPTSIP